MQKFDKSKIGLDSTFIVVPRLLVQLIGRILWVHCALAREASKRGAAVMALGGP
jgi:hypothetical protein